MCVCVCFFCNNKGISVPQYIANGASLILIFVLDVNACLFASAKTGDLINHKTNKVMGGAKALSAACLGTMLAAMIGCGPLIIHIESITG